MRCCCCLWVDTGAAPLQDVELGDEEAGAEAKPSTSGGRRRAMLLKGG